LTWVPSGFFGKRAQPICQPRFSKSSINAVGRLFDGYERERDEVRQNLSVAQGQLKDYEGRVGRPFAHADYASRLAELRDQLRQRLSEKPPEGGMPVVKLAEKIKELRAANTVEGTAERTGTRKAARAEVPVTARIRKPEVKVEEKQERPDDKSQAVQDSLKPAPTIEIKPEGKPPVYRPANHLGHVVKRRGNETQGRLF
jgi:hypothetical protein